MMENQQLLNNRYRLDTMIGRGGMAMVFASSDLMLERDVAIKLLRSRYAIDPAFRERFRQEAKAAANLSHPNIVTVYDFGYDQERLYIVMEFIRGKDLNTILEERSRLPIDRGLDLAIKTCKGIGYAHRAGLVHCDVKPHNLMVTQDWRLKVTDFGIARALASINPDEQSDVVWGSPQYFSPEQAAGEAPSPSSDVYSLGVVFYQMFTGQLPFIGKTSSEMSKLHREGIPIPPRELNPFLPESLEEVILKVLSKEPSTRYRTADQLGRVLQMVQREYVQSQEPKPARSETPSRPRRRKPVTGPLPSKPSRRKTTHPDTPSQKTTQRNQIDWLAVFLGLIMVGAWGGLIPFFIWVYNSII